MQQSLAKERHVVWYGRRQPLNILQGRIRTCKTVRPT